MSWDELDNELSWDELDNEVSWKDVTPTESFLVY